MKRFSLLLAFVVAVALGVITGNAYATPTMPTVTLPMDAASIVTSLTAVAVVVLLAIWPVKMGFLAIKMIYSRLRGLAR